MSIEEPRSGELSGGAAERVGGDALDACVGTAREVCLEQVRELAERGVAGDARAWLELLEVLGSDPMSRKQAWRRLGDRGALDRREKLENLKSVLQEGAQETIVALCRGELRRAEPEDVRCWHRKVVTRLARAVVASKRACGVLASEELLARAKAADPHVDDRPEIDAAIDLQRLLAHALEAIDDALPTGERDAMECHLEGLSQKEAAERLGITPNAYGVRLHAARKRLRELLGLDAKAPLLP